jgi:hypothetical protein
VRLSEKQLGTWSRLRGSGLTCLLPLGLCAEKPGGSGMLDVFFARGGGGLLRSMAHRGGGGGGELCFSKVMVAGGL